MPESFPLFIFAHPCLSFASFESLLAMIRQIQIVAVDDALLRELFVFVMPRTVVLMRDACGLKISLVLLDWSRCQALLPLCHL